MKVAIECYPCLLKQILSTIGLCGLRDEQKKDVMHFALNTMAGLSDAMYPHEVVVAVNEYVHRNYCHVSDIFDPYAEIKHQTRRMAQQFYYSVQHTIERSSNPLEVALKCAALGNIIDFGVQSHEKLDVRQELEQLESLEFAHYDFTELAHSLGRARRILYIADNVGEDIFDKAFIQEIHQEYQAVEIIFAVRDRPIINDVTLDDARASGLDQVATIISSGSIYPGTILPRTTRQFQEIFAGADVIISKGQGNFETLSDEVHDNLFFLLRAKCDRVADFLGVALGSMVLKKSDSV